MHRSRAKRRRRDLSLPLASLGDASISGLERRVIEDQYDTTITGNGHDADPSWGTFLFLSYPKLLADPALGYIVDQIVAGNLQVEYERVFRTTRGESILEVVWNLPDSETQGDPRGGPPDQYVVFHFHVEHLWTVNGQQFPGIYAMVAFHGQTRINSGRNAGRVDGNDPVRNLRARVLECNTGDESNDETYFWYPGYLEQNGVSGSMAILLARFGAYMRSMGIITAQTFTDPTRGQLAVIDHEDPTCPTQQRSYFDWGEYTLSRPFMPERGNAPGPGPGGRSDSPAEQDNDGTR